MNETELVTQDQIHDIVEERITPTSKIEAGLSDFLTDTFKMVQEEDLYKKSIQSEIISRLSSFKNSELIALATSQATNENDMLSKIVSPTMALLTAAQQAEMARQQKEVQNQQNVLSQVNVREVNQVTPNEVQVGMKALMDLVQAVGSNVKNADA